ncbi:hypothetical protein Fot_51103 [Forsythia ovata]|uniref:Uncharacterized protein n=1 Tax=Forsythia ovata TaxID=205694 RepID=A0ABD1PUH8_9LAMI
MEFGFLFSNNTNFSVPPVKITSDMQLKWLIELNKRHHTPLCVTLIRREQPMNRPNAANEADDEVRDELYHNRDDFWNTVEIARDDDVVFPETNATQRPPEIYPSKQPKGTPIVQIYLIVYPDCIQYPSKQPIGTPIVSIYLIRVSRSYPVSIETTKRYPDCPNLPNRVLRSYPVSFETTNRYPDCQYLPNCVSRSYPVSIETTKRYPDCPNLPNRVSLS